MLSLADVAKITGLSRASVRRALLTLEVLGYVGSRRNRFYLRPRVLDLGYAFLSSSSNIDVTQDQLRRQLTRILTSQPAETLPIAAPEAPAKGRRPRGVARFRSPPRGDGEA